MEMTSKLQDKLQRVLLITAVKEIDKTGLLVGFVEGLLNEGVKPDAILNAAWSMIKAKTKEE